MARYDKYDPISGGFRAPLNADLPLTGGSIGPVAVSLNTSGRIVIGTGGQSGLVGILVKNAAKGPIQRWGTELNGGTPNPYAPIGAMAGDIVDIMTAGEIVDLGTMFTTGQPIYAAADGTLSTTAEGGTRIGFTLGGDALHPLRLVVRISA